MKKNSFFKKYKKTIIIAASCVVLALSIGVVLIYQKRDAILKSAVQKGIIKAKSTYNLNVKIASYGFSGLSSVYFNAIDVVPQDKEKLASINDLTVGVKLWPLLFGNIKIAELAIHNATISLVKKDTISNYDFLFKKDTKDTVKTDSKADLSELANKLLSQTLDKIPDDLDVKNFLIKFDHDTTQFNVLAESATINGGEVNSTIKLNTNQAVWHVAGTANPSKQQLDLKFYADNKKVEVPYLFGKYGLKLSFDTVRTIMTSAEREGDNFEIEGTWYVRNLLINHPRIAAKDVIVKTGSIDAKMLIGKNYIALDSSSIVSLGNAQINPFVKITLGEKKIYELKVNAYDQVAQHIFDAFPIGLFESLEGIKVQGKLDYALNFHLDAAKPEKVIFNSTLTGSDDFKILKFGETNFQKINSSFVYTPYEKGKPVRDIIIGPENPNYTPITSISPNIKNALLTSEDPSFYNHKGFVEESIRQSIATNFKAKSFKRGGSTISMQLVKNVYLSRNKNLARKFEEILIVWLIENQHLTSKSRMYEVYLNVIEWGRNVYGIGEASRYYFSKSPAELTIGEAIYLAHIVPKPKSSLYSWQPNGGLKYYLTGYFNLIGRLMARRGYIEQDSSNYGFYNVRLRESLRKQIAPSDYLPDSLAEEDENGFFNLDIFNRRTPKDSLEKKETFLKKIFTPEQQKVDSLSKTPKELRQERRDKRKESQKD
ncbi:transglycosylase domain-containing protein [Pedobacter alpinus]|uniref:Transglycosylase domain-containing protein n=1 Tax=Pedobacter alpinus TaxID=1590643 RepID=A0ABW5TLD5_9SPHI